MKNLDPNKPWRDYAKRKMQQLADMWPEVKPTFEALIEVRDRKLYREEFETFEAFVAARFGADKAKLVLQTIELLEHPERVDIQRSN